MSVEPAEEPITLEEAKSHLRVDIEDDDNLILNLITAARQKAESILKRALITQTWIYYPDDFPDKDYIELPMPPLQSVSSVTYTDYNGAVTIFGSATVQASGTITVTNTPVADQHLTMGQVFHFKAARSGAGEITIDADNTIQAHNIVTAITADIPSTVTATHSLGVVTLTAVSIGSLGNSIVLTTDATGVAVSGSGTLSGGITAEYVADTKKEPGRIVLAYGQTWPSTTLTVTSPIAITYLAGYGTPEDVPMAVKQGMLILISTWYENRESIIIGQTPAHLKTVEALLDPYVIHKF